MIDRARQGPYPVYSADPLNVLAQLELNRRNHERASVAAAEAFEFAWCDGQPFAYAAGLAAARDVLGRLGQPTPEMKPLDRALCEPLPEVRIDVGEDTL